MDLPNIGKCYIIFLAKVDFSKFIILQIAISMLGRFYISHLCVNVEIYNTILHSYIIDTQSDISNTIKCCMITN